MHDKNIKALAEINITPLIDVMLVLLIIFMGLLPTAQKGLDTALPQSPTQDAPDPPAPIMLSIEDSPAGPLIAVNKSPVANLEELENRLREIYQTRSDRTIFVRGAGTVRYGQVVEVMDAAKGAGAERIGLMTERAEAPGQ